MRPGQRLVDEPLVPRVRCIQLGVAVRAVRRPPALHGRDPLVGHLGQHCEPGAHVLAPFGVVRRRRQHRHRPPPLPACAALVEVGDRDDGAVGLEADVIEAQQGHPPVERRVFFPLCGDRPGELLEAGDEPVLGVSREIAEQQRLEEREDAVVEIGPRRARVSQHGVDEPAIGGCGRHAWAHVAAVRGRVHAELDDSVSQLGSGEVARPSVALAHPQQELYDPLDVRGE